MEQGFRAFAFFIESLVMQRSSKINKKRKFNLVGLICGTLLKRRSECQELNQSQMSIIIKRFPKKMNSTEILFDT